MRIEVASLLFQLSWPELRHHIWRHLSAWFAVVLGVALAFAVHLINESALGEFSAAVRSVNGQPDFELRESHRAFGGGFDETLYARVAAHPQVVLASPVLEIETYALDTQGRRVALRILGLDALVAAPLSLACCRGRRRGKSAWPSLTRARSFSTAAHGAGSATPAR